MNLMAQGTTYDKMLTEYQKTKWNLHSDFKFKKNDIPA